MPPKCLRILEDYKYFWSSLCCRYQAQKPIICHLIQLPYQRSSRRCSKWEEESQWGIWLVDFKLSTGKNQVAFGNGLFLDVVTSLINENYLGSGYNIFCDNFYTSPLLFWQLGQWGFGAYGTYRQVRLCVPFTEENALNRKSPRGFIWWITDCELFVKWMDTREVSLYSNIHRTQCCDGRWEKRERDPIPRPTAVADYNRYMGGVDTSDQMLGTHSVHRKTRWYITMLKHFVDTAVTNSNIIHKEICAKQQQRQQSRQELQEEMCAHLLGVSLKSRLSPTPSGTHFPCCVSSRGEA